MRRNCPICKSLDAASVIFRHGNSPCSLCVAVKERAKAKKLSEKMKKVVELEGEGNGTAVGLVLPLLPCF